MIRYFDMFAGVGGFRAGLTRAGGFACVGHSEIDRYADASYRAIHNPKESEVFYADARTIEPDDLPDFDLLCGGFPCQAFSLAGKRRGFEDGRGTLFFELVRIAAAKRPPYLLFENVPGILSHDQGKTFACILDTLCELGYGVEWLVLNSKDHGVPQSRRRVFIVGFLDKRCAGKILPYREANPASLVRMAGRKQGYTLYDSEGLACTQTSNTGGFGGKTGLYFINSYKSDLSIPEKARHNTAGQGHSPIDRKGACLEAGVLRIKEATKKGYKEAGEGDTVNFSYAGSNTRRGRVGRDMAHTLNTSSSQGVVRQGRIRRLTPRECFRLQGFGEEQIDRILAITSVTQAYKQAGNAVTVNVIEAIGKRLRAMDEGLKAGSV